MKREMDTRHAPRFAWALTGALALALVYGAACGPKKAPNTPAPAPTPAPAARPATPPPSTPPATPPPAVSQPPATPPAAAPPAGGAGAAGAAGAAAAGGGGRGGRAGGAPPAPIEPPPAVMPKPVDPIVSANKPDPDPRVGLKPGRWDAAQAAWNMKMISTTPPTAASMGQTHSDLAFSSHYAIQGNYNGFEIWDISNPAKPVIANAYVCPASQNDVSVYKNLLFMSSEATNSRSDCKLGGVPDPVSKDRVRGVRIFDISDVKNPKLVTSVQNCRGSHTHTVVTQPGDPNNVYIYISGTSGVRPEEELAGCKASADRDDPNGSQFRLDVIKVPLAHPEQAAIVSNPRIFQDLPSPPSNPERDAAAGGRGGGGGRAGAAGAAGAGAAGAAGAGAAGAGAAGAGGGAAGRAGAAGAANAGGAAGAAGAAGAPPGAPGGGRGGGPRLVNQCHDITVYPEAGLAGGACAGLGLLLDIREASHPIRIDMAADPNMSFWHSATFSNDGTKVLFSDEWGGGSAPRCRSTDKLEWGGDALFTIEKNKLVFHSYYKMPAAQTDQENCVAHNGSMIPIPGRDVMVQAFYQGGLTIFDWTDVAHPKEIAFFDRGPLMADRLGSAGSWSAYWYNGVIVSSEIARGLDIYELVANPNITQNEIDAAKTVKFDYFNTQEQRKFVWPPSFALAKAYVDQLERSKGLSAARITAVRQALTAAEGQSGGARRTALTTLATSITADAAGSSDAAKVKLLAAAVTDLAK
jgi:LVIVD repeat